MAILKVKDKDGNIINIPAIKGDKGEAGISISSIEQTKTSTENNGENIVSITMSNGQIFNFSILNGSQGNTGSTGATGETGMAGKNGVTFTPSVDSSGNLSWTNNGGLENPTSVNIRDGVSIASVEQTTTSTESGGVNTITVTLSDGTTSTFNILNGEKGEVGGTLTDLGITATAAEINYLDGVTSSVQTQLGGKQATITGAASTVTTSNLTASRVLVSNSSGKIAVSSAVTSTELGYLDGVTSKIQTQLDNKQASISGGASTITSSNLTVNRALISNSSGKVAVSAVTSTELGYLDGVTSAIQTQLDGKSSTDHTHSGYAESSHTHTGYVPTSRTVNGKALSSNISLTASDVGASASGHTHTGYVPTTRSINGKALSSNITLSASDVSAAASSHNHVASEITSGTLEVARGGTGYTSIADTTYTTARYRASAIVSSATNPSTNGVINWTYE